MSFVKLYSEYFEYFTTILHPRVSYSRSSSGKLSGLTGPVARPSEYKKDLFDDLIATGKADFWGEFYPFSTQDFSLTSLMRKASKKFQSASLNDTEAELRSLGGITAIVEKYMSDAHIKPQSGKNLVKLPIVRFTPPFKFSTKTLVKSAMQGVLGADRVAEYTNPGWCYTNYNTLNFFTSSDVPTDSCLVYNGAPRRVTTWTPTGVSKKAWGLQYLPTGAVSFDFYINPRYTNDHPGAEFKAGTIFHLSSSYVVSLASGSSMDKNGLVNSYRLMLQLSHSADIAPSTINTSVPNNTRNYPEDLIFVSKDNVLPRNEWSHVCIRWGTPKINDGTGSFTVNGHSMGNFSLPSASMRPPVDVEYAPFPQPYSGQLFVGNYYEGWDDSERFFNRSASYVEGVIPQSGDKYGNKIRYYSGDPSGSSPGFRHPLNAEVHDLKIFDSYMTSDDIEKNMTKGRGDDFDTGDLLFYVPPLFVREAPTRSVHITPYHSESRATTLSPFNINMSFGVGGKLINLDNFVRDFAGGTYPRLFMLTASYHPDPPTPTSLLVSASANEVMYSKPSVRKRNLTILPCDNGKFKPNFRLLASASKSNFSKTSWDTKITTPLTRFVDPLTGELNLTVINLEDLVPTGSVLYPWILSGKSAEYVATKMIGGPSAAGYGSPTPLAPGRPVLPGAGARLWPLTTSPKTREEFGTRCYWLYMLHETMDRSSNEVTMFNISNLYYGNKINPETFFVADDNLSASGGKVKMILKDNGMGSLYRADCTGSHATWSSVGSVFYEDGLVVVKSPHAPFFGSGSFRMGFEGTQGMHTLIINVPLASNAFNSSSHPNYKKLKPSGDVNDLGETFVYLTNLNIHDDNLNIIMKSNFAQPVKKRVTDEILLRFKMDF